MRTARPRTKCSSLPVRLLLALIAPLAAHADALSELDDVAARIQYASYTADVRGIEDALALVGRLELPESRKAMKDYYAAYGQWKLAELQADEVAAGRRAARASSIKAAKACEDAAESATKLDARLAEAHAMSAICSALASRAPDVLSLGGCERHKQLRIARELEPSNPRIRLIEAQCMRESEKAPGAMLARVRAIAKDFDSAPPGSPGRPDWGQPEALLLLGELQLQQGDRGGARDSLERALVIAPDYRKAREQLQKVATSP
jgi:hypothetical protein